MKIDPNIRPDFQVQEQKTTAKNPTDKGAFASKLEGSSIGKFVDKTIEDSQKIDQSMKRLSKGANLSNAELLKMQSLMYRYTQEVDLASKIVDKTAAGFKQLMNIQV